MILDRLKKNDIFQGGELYLRRFYLFPTNDRDEKLSRFPFAIKIHQIYLSDKDSDLHCHPWDFVSIILKGGYMEETPKGKKWRGRGSVIIKRAEDLHRLKVSEVTTTLVICGKARRVWGFQTANGWVPWYDYLGTGK